MNKPKHFSLSPKNFTEEALRLFAFQYENNLVYQQFCKLLNKNPTNINELEAIPFLPIEFFKTHTILSDSSSIEAIFTSSGTTGDQTSKHHVTDLSIYENSYLKAFHQFYGDVEDYLVLGLLPSYLERNGSSLIYMVNHFIKKSKYAESGFFLDDFELLKNTIEKYDGKRNILLIGVSFALLDFSEQFQFQLKSTIIMETGGMKGRRKEMIREELHEQLKSGFGVEHIHSEYGMTELLSQAYSKGNGIFNCPSSMKILIRNTDNPLEILQQNQTGGINVIDLANVNSIAFIATQDLGKEIGNNQYQILGRFDHSDVRGCNLMVL
ncbi:LuxE/PaaK family acyltransferase [Psychroflexus planctonicus]|uniref:Acyltransferase n=1 Tax=Psychroflexus planctonicus TaxID=1526575 RepID=A0ABQ1SFW8_9FLAO|nr:acyl transferase [Psychroflexus planctonicus]GGE36907.1 acyltransferase [Psychroflexus planctonicus]